MDAYRNQLRRRFPSQYPQVTRVRNVLRNANLSVRSRSAKSRAKSAKGFSSFLLDVFQILLRFLSKPHILLLYVCAFAVVYTRSVSPDKDFIKRLAADYPNNPLFSWAQSNFAKFVGLFVFVPVFVDASPRVQPVLVSVVSTVVLMLPPQTALLYLVCAFSLHVYSKASSSSLRFMILGLVIAYMVSTNSFNVNSLFRAVSTVPSVVPPVSKPVSPPPSNPPKPKPPLSAPPLFSQADLDQSFRVDPPEEVIKEPIKLSSADEKALLETSLPPIVRRGPLLPVGGEG
ncbi:p31 [Pistachio virus X]|uniref:p31 n=1 Tax=Pistachio virus X TaxID=2794236 RepID=A0A7T0M858_9VIRU|nr:p31 [Pistachio virus X]